MPDQHDRNPDRQGDEGTEGEVRPKAQGDAEARGDALAAFEPQLDRKHVPQDGRNPHQEP